MLTSTLPEPAGHNLVCEARPRLGIGPRREGNAAHLGDRAGSLEAGKLADIVLVGHDDHDQFTSLDPTITLSQNVIGHHVRTTIVDGRVVMKDREFLTADIPKMRADVKQRYPRMIERFEKAIQLTSG